RVHRQGLPRPDAEESGIELAGVIQEAALADIALARRSGIGIVQVLQVPTPTRWEATDRVAAGGHHLPQPISRAHAPRIATRHSHDRHRLPRSLPHLAHTAASILSITVVPCL